MQLIAGGCHRAVAQGALNQVDGRATLKSVAGVRVARQTGATRSADHQNQKFPRCDQSFGKSSVIQLSEAQ
jgi:hypothetical protein